MAELSECVIDKTFRWKEAGDVIDLVVFRGNSAVIQRAECWPNTSRLWTSAGPSVIGRTLENAAKGGLPFNNVGAGSDDVLSAWMNKT